MARWAHGHRRSLAAGADAQVAGPAPSLLRRLLRPGFEA